VPARGNSIPLILATIGAGACSAAVPARAALPDSGIRGLVVIGPTCPVERYPPDPACGPRPYVATIAVRGAVSHRLLRSVRSSSTGRFTVRLLPGTYVLEPSPGPGIARPVPSGRAIRVVAHRFAFARIEYDSGIR
jgi:hypothetical protein